MSQRQLLLFNQSLPLDQKGMEFLHVQVWLEKPEEVTLKHSKKEESGTLNTLSVFRFPLNQIQAVCATLLEAEKEVGLEKEIEAPLSELFKKYPREKVEEAFARVKQSRVGMPT